MRKLWLPWFVSSLLLALGLATAEDARASKMYWTDAGTDKIQRADLDGTNVEDLVTTGLITPAGIALDLASGKMYWTNQDFDTPRVQRAGLAGEQDQ